MKTLQTWVKDLTSCISESRLVQPEAEHRQYSDHKEKLSKKVRFCL